MNGAIGGAIVGADVGRVVMPLVRLLCQNGLSWSNREEIADAIRNTLRVHGDMEKEREHLTGMAEQAPKAPKTYVASAVGYEWGKP